MKLNTSKQFLSPKRPEFDRHGINLLLKFFLEDFLQLQDTLIKIKSVAYSSQGNHTGQLDFCNWLADGSTTDLQDT